MKKELIEELFAQFESACYFYEGLECWSARELQSILGYTKWDNFVKVIDKAKESCANSGGTVSDHFADIGKMVAIGSGTEREIEDIALTRYACYLVAQNGDATKNEIAFAQTYFAVQTRKQEIIERRLLDIDRVPQGKSLPEAKRYCQQSFTSAVLMTKDLPLSAAKAIRHCLAASAPMT
jgi:DNA-damage-inducible protein D